MGQLAFHRAEIPPVMDTDPRPMWSVMIPTFNCARFLPTALASVLGQDPGREEMQIEVVDDCSSDDDIEKIVAETSNGRVAIYRQSQNVGHIENFATCLRRARGHLIHLLHGDDYIGPGFYRRLQQSFTTRPDLGAAFCRTVYVDAQGVPHGKTELERSTPGMLEDAVHTLALEQRIMTPSMVVRRTVYERLGGFDTRLACAEDWEMWVRIASRYPLWYDPEPLAFYRTHQDSNTGRNQRSGNNIRYTHLAIDLLQQHLPPESGKTTAARAKQTYAVVVLQDAMRLLRDRDYGTAAAFVREGLRLSRSPCVFYRTLISGAKSTLSSWASTKSIKRQHP